MDYFVLYVIAWSGFNDIEESTERDQLILRLLNGEQSYIMLRENEFTFGSPHLSYNYFREPGLFEKTTKLMIKRFLDRDVTRN